MSVKVGFGHIQKECPNFLMKQKIGYNVTLSDDDSDSDSDQISNFVVFTASVTNHNLNDHTDVCSSSLPTDNYALTDDDDELSSKVLNETYNFLHTKWIEE